MAYRRPSDVADTNVAEGGAAGADATSATQPRQSESAQTGDSVTPSEARLGGGRFATLRRIGAGGMGVVYEAYDTERQERVALKMLHERGPGATYDLKKEFRALGGIAHPNLIRLHELFADGARWFFTMDLVEGEPFDVWVRNREHGDSERRLREGLAQLVDAVNALHAHGKLHRDLKPSNVLVTREGRVIVLDFGLAMDSETDSRQSFLESGVSGTPAYMAPEQAAGARASRACDAYGIGVMLFECLTGRLPFLGSPLEMLVAKQGTDPPAASAFAPQAPRDLNDVCMALLARNPQSRALLTELSTVWGMRSQSAHIPQGTANAPVLYGRETEMAELRDAFEATRRRGAPVLILLSGESGIGKSALVEAFLIELRERHNVLALSGRCFERESVPFKAFDVVVDAISRYLRKLPDSEVGALLPRDTFALRMLFPVLGRIPAVANGPTRDIPDALELRRRAFLAFSEMLGRICDRSLVVLHLDDLQWSDTDSIVLLLHMLRQVDAPTMLVIASHRHEAVPQHPCLGPLYEFSAVKQATDVRRVELGPLTDEASLQLLGSARGEVHHALLEEAAGNPFFLSELARHAASESKTPWRDLSLRSLVAARTQQLGASERHLLETLAVAARPLPLELAMSSTRLPVAPRAVFETLRAEHLARATGNGTLVECFHDKVRVAVLRSLSPERLRERNDMLAQALAAAASPDPEQLAAHLLAAGRALEAGRQLVRAAERAKSELGFDRAARLYSEALTHGKFDPATIRQLQVQRGDSYALSGQGKLAAESYLAAREHAVGDEHNDITRKAAEQYLVCGDLARGRELLGEALRPLGIHMPLSAAGLLASLSWNRGRLSIDRLKFVARTEFDEQTQRRLAALREATSALIRADQVRGADFAARNVRAALRAGHRVELVRALGLDLILAGMSGAPTRTAERMLALAEESCLETDDALGRLWLCFGRGTYRMFARGEFALGLADSREYYALAAANPYPTMFQDRRWVLLHEGVALLYLGRFTDAAQLWESLSNDAWSSGDLTIIPPCAMLGCLVLPIVGAHDRAAYELERARAAWPSHDEVTLQEALLFVASLAMMLHRGPRRSTWDALRLQRQRIHRSLMSRVPIGKVVDAWSCVAAAAIAMRPQDDADRRELLRNLAHTVSRLRGAKHVLAPPFAPVVASAHGDCTLTVNALREVIRDPRTAPIFVNAARRQLGVHLGGEDGRSLVAEADAFFASGGSVSPAQLAATLLPCFEH